MQTYTPEITEPHLCEIFIYKYYNKNYKPKVVPFCEKNNKFFTFFSK